MHNVHKLHIKVDNLKALYFEFGDVWALVYGEEERASLYEFTNDVKNSRNTSAQFFAKMF